ncbi:ABC transporter substrate-binding protein [Billgrantia endophytica]|uniref:Peptide ABC transporter substrate-binding protein n=1 Tax=Billgrantia endophytica TaxID=2033802 RepID=A0A2N7UAE5_9GAMM|nr:ABC transporter substrate-binding protein [Halomonas endophytica]PMR77371.1 peptide ABC transporter substrate-binding protein [Halomonas endophytica]
MMLKKTLLASVVIGAMLATAANAETLRWTRSADSLTMDPHSQNEGPTHAVNHQVFDTLLYQDMDVEYQPGLATEWYVKEDDPTVWVFKIREGVTFHEGQSLTADDVVFSLNRARHEHADMRGLLTAIAEVRAADDYTVEVVTHDPNPLLPNNLTNLFIMSHEWAEEHGVEEPQNYAAGEETYAVRNANGTGPFRVESREPDVRTVFVRNDEYWGIDHYPMEISRLIYTPIESASTRVAALLSGEVDLLQETPVQDIERLANAEGLKNEQGAENRTIFLGMQMGAASLETTDVDDNPFADHRVREAINLAVDATTIQTAVMRGNSEPAGMIAPPFVNGYTEEMDVVLPADLDRAQELMAEAGYEDGFRVTLQCPNDRYVNDEQICQAVVSMLARIGITVDLAAQTRSIFFAELARGEYDFYLLGWGVPTMDSEYVFNYLYHTKEDDRGSWNFTGYSDERVDELTVSMGQEVDEDVRNEMIAEAWQIVHDEIVYIPIHHQMLTWSMRDDIDFKVQSENTPHFKYLKFNN